jgi:uncharacterized iron-regulated membrane protein
MISRNPDAPTGAALYRSLWRWHFYAGLFCVPFVIVLAITGSIYLFKPQVEAALDRPFDHMVEAGPYVPAAAQVTRAVAAVPGSHFSAYEVRDPRDATRVLVGLADGSQVRVYLHPATGAVLKVTPEDQRLMEVVKTLHGELLLGTGGSIVVELAGAWALVMVVSGLYLWWPRGRAGVAGILYPRLNARGRPMWRDLHAVAGFWVSAFAIFLLVTALPWTTVWADGFAKVREVAGLVSGPVDWTQSRAGEHAAHRMAQGHMHRPAPVLLDAMIASVRAQGLAPPVMIAPPSAASPAWTARSDTQDRPRRATLTLDAATGAVAGRKDFADGYPIDQAVGYGVAAHEGQLFGPANQILALLTTSGLILVCVSGYVMWWKRRPRGELGAPAAPADRRIGWGLAAILIAFALFLPVFGISLVVIGALEGLILRRIPPVRRWLGLASSTTRSPA